MRNLNLRGTEDYARGGGAPVRIFAQSKSNSDDFGYDLGRCRRSCTAGEPIHLVYSIISGGTHVQSWKRFLDFQAAAVGSRTQRRWVEHLHFTGGASTKLPCSHDEWMEPYNEAPTPCLILVKSETVLRLSSRHVFNLWMDDVLSNSPSLLRA